MRVGQTIKIIASKPAKGQTGIEHLVGQSYVVAKVHWKEDSRSRYREDGTVSVKAMGGLIVLQPGEFA